MRYPKGNRRMLNLCNSQKGYALLKYLERFQTAAYSELGKVLFEKDKNGKFSLTAYYVRTMKRHGVVEKNHKNYQLTKKGKRILHFLDSLNVKYISEDEEQICRNSLDSCEHNFVTICRNCAYIKKPEQETIPMIISQKVKKN